MHCHASYLTFGMIPLFNHTGSAPFKQFL